VRAIRNCIEEHEADLIHTHGYKADIYGYISARLLRKPILATYHSSPDRTTRLRLYGTLDRVFLKRFDTVVAISSERRRALQEFGVPSSRISMIWNGIDGSAFGNAVPARAGALGSVRGKVVGVVARLVPEKGIQVLLRAASEVVRQYPDTLFLVVGSGPQRAELEELAAQLGVSANVRFLGQQHNMPAIYAAMDIVVLPTFDEGLPMCVLEAQAASKAVIATAVGGTPDVIHHNENGLLVQPRETAELRDAILRLLGDPAFCVQLGRNGEAHIQAHFSSDAMASKYRVSYEAIVGQHQAA